MPNNHRNIIRKIFSTSHKILLHRDIDKHLGKLKGNILVIGGGNEPYKDLCKSRNEIIVTDIRTDLSHIDLVADAHSLPFYDGAFDVVIAVEVFEHLADPEKASSEIFRVLRKDGLAVVTIPFMFRIHGDPYDFQRFTYQGLLNLFKKFSDVNIKAFGNRIHVISDILTTSVKPFFFLRIINHFLCFPLFTTWTSKDCPSGYIVKLKK